MIHDNAHLQVKMNRLKGLLCDSVSHTAVSMTIFSSFLFCLFVLFGFSFSFKFGFDLGGRLGERRADVGRWRYKLEQNA